MTDHLFSATLTFALLAGGTTAIGSEWFGATGRPSRATATATAIAQPSVATVVTLPDVTVIGRRPTSTAVAAETRSEQPRRVQ